MLIAPNMVVTFDYTLTNAEGEVLDASDDGPMVYLHGHGNVVPGLERALLGRSAGDELKVQVDPKDGYGEVSGRGTIRVGRDEVPPDMPIEEGVGFAAQTPDGDPVTLWVVDFDEKGIEMSLDHPLAGVTLHFDVQVCEVRAATEEEIEHGHVHDGHGHHGH
jgi:FKBP-type peptidyl-prolyl cis-trans isomerase SlyD